MATDPICHMQVDEATALSARVDGQTYYFCSEYCRQEFLAEASDRQASGQRQAAEESAAACCHRDGGATPPHAAVVPPAAGYYCPMDPGVHSDRPGACPICGMTLVPVPGSADEDDPEARDMSRRLWVSLAFALPVLLLAMLPMSGVPVD